MADNTPVKVAVDCSTPDRDAVVAYTQDQVEAVLKQRTDGNITSEEAAATLVALADQAVDAAGIPDRVTVVPLVADELTQRAIDQAAAEAAAAAPATPAELAAVPAQMAAANLAATFTTTDEVAAAAEQLHAAAKAGIANFKADLAAWATLTDAQKLSHVQGLMQSMVAVLQNLTGDYS
jgi:hypothetical protein